MSQLQEKILRAKEDLDAVYEAGKKSGGEDYLQYATKVQFQNWNLFGKSEVEITIPENITDYMMIFQETTTANTMVEHLIVNGKVTGSASMAFATMGGYDTKLTHLTLNCDFSKCTGADYMFSDRQVLENIDGTPLDFSNCTYIGPLAPGCTNLKEIRFAPLSIKGSIDLGASSSLSYETIESLFNGLTTVTTKKTITLNSAQKILESHKNTANANGWTISGGMVVSEEW